MITPAFTKEQTDALVSSMAKSQIRLHAAKTDRWIAEHMRKGDADIDAEAVRRCLMPCPEMMRKRHEQKKHFTVRTFREDWYR